LAWPADLKSLSRQKPGQSRGFQAKLGRNITKGNCPPLQIEAICELGKGMDE